MDSVIGAHEFLQYLRFGYPPVLLVILFVVFLVHSSQVAKNAAKDANQNTEVQYGPGGKPLPRRTRMMMAVARDLPAELALNRYKGWFFWLSVFVLATYVAEAAIHMTHAIISKSEQWWCGQAVVVRLLFQKLKSKLTKMPVLCRWVLLHSYRHLHLFTRYKPCTINRAIRPMAVGHSFRGSNSLHFSLDLFSYPPRTYN